MKIWAKKNVGQKLAAIDELNSFWLKNTRPPKGASSGKQLFNPYPSVFTKSFMYAKLLYIYVTQCLFNFKNMIVSR